MKSGRRFQWQRLTLVCIDTTFVALALAAGYQLRWDFNVPHEYELQLGMALLIWLPVRVGLFALFSLYRGLLRYAGTSELLAIGFSVLLGTAILATVNLGVVPLLPAFGGLPQSSEHRLLRVPRSVMLIEPVMTLMLVGAGRFGRRIALTGLLHRRLRSSNALRRVVIVGASDTGEAVARQMLHAATSAHHPAAFVDENPQWVGRTIHGIPVAGVVEDLPTVIANFSADEVLVAIGGIGPARLREIVDLCEHARVGIRILPDVRDVLEGRVSINQIRPVEIEDLLGRDPIRMELPADRNYVRGQIVLVTGAGGSIGSELCRQLMALGPARILLLGHGENSIYEISQELNSVAASQGGPSDLLVPLIGDIREESKVQAIFHKYRPDVVFHAAAHKHVPLMEAHPDEAVKNNVGGTHNVVRAAEANGAKKFIMISSDKAVRPTNVMGATKRVAEMIVFTTARTSVTQLVAVRFGNVLGSRGSVVPLFKRQIARGGPVTLTHPEIVRYFMTIPEAVSLVIQAGSMADQGRLYLLDMGEPVRIADLARNLIRLSGFDPDTDIEIQYTGLRPGEKLKEELLTAGEGVKSTELGKIFTAEPEDVDPAWLWPKVQELMGAAKAMDGDEIREKLREIVPDYGPES